MGYINKKDNECAWAVDDNRGMITNGSLTLLMDEDKVKFKRVGNVSEDHKAGTIVVADEDGNIDYVYPWDDSNGELLDVQNMLFTMRTEYNATPIGVIVVPESHSPNGIARMVGIHSENDYYSEINTFHDNEEEMNPRSVCIAVGLDDEIEEYCENNDGMDLSLPSIQRPILDSTYKNHDNISVYDNGWRWVPICHEEVDTMAGNNGYYVYDNPYDTSTKWASDGAQCEPLMPSPYLNNGKPNSIYRVNELSFYDSEYNETYTFKNGLSDMDGKNNTYKICKIAERNEINVTEDVEYCINYSTKGTKPGDWYLPSIGEVGYLLARYGKIRTALRQCCDFLYGDDGAYEINIYQDIISSTYYDVNARWMFTPCRYTYNDESFNGNVTPFAYVLGNKIES